jgi:hypothetical protein
LKLEISVKVTKPYTKILLILKFFYLNVMHGRRKFKRNMMHGIGVGENEFLDNLVHDVVVGHM